jgi:hypothetical protein
VTPEVSVADNFDASAITDNEASSKVSRGANPLGHLNNSNGLAAKATADVTEAKPGNKDIGNTDAKPTALTDAAKPVNKIINYADVKPTANLDSAKPVHKIIGLADAKPAGNTDAANLVNKIICNAAMMNAARPATKGIYYADVEPIANVVPAKSVIKGINDTAQLKPDNTGTFAKTARSPADDQAWQVSCFIAIIAARYNLLPSARKASSVSLRGNRVKIVPFIVIYLFTVP